MRNYYEGWSEADLLALRKTLQTESGSGQVIRSSIAGVSVEKSPFAGGSAARDQTSARVQYSLWLIGQAQVADETSGITVNPYEQPYLATVKRTRPSYV
jgi:hypothetical protein